MTVCVNLIPDSRQQIRVRRKRIRRWILAGAVYGWILLMGCGLLRVFASQDDPDVALQVEKVQDRIELIRSSIVDMQNLVSQHELTLLANRDLVEHPDWGLLLGLLAQSLSDELVLRGCEIQQQTSSPAGRSRPSNESGSRDVETTFQLVIKGMGRTQADVSQFVLRLEKTGLFGSVKLVDTNLEPYLTGKAVAFRLECQLGELTP